MANITEPVSSNSTTDLTSCDREQVQFSGAIQPHGLLLVLEEPQLIVSHASSNTVDFLGQPAADLLNKPLSRALPLSQADALLGWLKENEIACVPVHLGAIPLHSRNFEVFAHRMGNRLIFELELATHDPSAATLLYGKVRSCLAELHSARTIPAVLDIGVRYIHQLTEYDRVVGYKFLGDGTGQVLAEARREDLPSLLGVHYPPGDIPAPARRILSLVWVRSQPDTQYIPVPIEAANPDAAPLDLSYSMLRSTSAMCNRFYKNLGVRSKLIVALVNNGELWGAINCHSELARPLTYETRVACETIAHGVSVLLGEKDKLADAEQSAQVQKNAQTLIEKISKPQFSVESLTQGLLTCLPAGGAAAILDGRIHLQGKCPDENSVRTLVGWLEKRALSLSNPTYSTHSLSSVFPPAKAFNDVASGLLAVRLGEGSYLFWFRPEVVYEVTWAGDPTKPVEVDEKDGKLRLAPRTSFDLRRSSLSGLSEAWRTYEVDAAATLGRSVRAALETAELARSMQKLQEKNAELETFAHTASHDLQTPLRGISLYSHSRAADILGDKGETEESRLQTIHRLASRMDELLQTLLRCSREGRVTPEQRWTDLNEILDQVRETLKPQPIALHATIRNSRLPQILCNPVQMQQILVNLVTNGLKYNYSEAKEVEVGVLDNVCELTLYVRDNGIGISPEKHSQIFTIFRRLPEGEEHAGGEGIGLAIVKKIIEGQGGKIWVESAVGTGSTFFFTVPQDASTPNTQSDRVSAG